MATRVIYLALVWLHVVATMLWVGGVAFFPLVALPVARNFPVVASALTGAIGRRFRVIGWVCLGILLVTGPMLLWLHGIRPRMLLAYPFWSSAFGQVLAVKLALVVALLAVTLWHDLWLGPRVTTGDLAALRWARYGGRAMALLSLLVVAAAVVLVRGV